MWENPVATVRTELGDDEHLLWAGRPKQGVTFRGSDVYMIPFSLMWGGFAIFWEILALSLLFAGERPLPLGVAIIFTLFGLPFVLVGLYAIFGRFIVDWQRRAKTFYGLTNQRIIIISGLFSRKVKSMYLRTLSEITLSEKSDRTGTITFGRTDPWSAWFQNMGWPGVPREGPSFEMIEDAKRVYERIRGAQSKA
jgi:hypothetical protein